MNASTRAATAIAAGILGWTAFPPLGWWPMSIVSVAGLAVSVHGVRARRGGWLGLAYGVAFFLPLLSWIHVLGNDALVALAVLEALFLAGLGAALAAVSRLRAWPLWSALLWVTQELARGVIPFGGFPWGRLAYAQAGSPLGHLAAYGSAALVSSVVALAGSLLAYGVIHVTHPLRTAHRSGLAVAGVIALVAVPAVLPATMGAAAAGATPQPVAIIQGNVPGDGMDALGEARTVTRNHLAATEQLAAEVAAGTVPKPAFVIWPENSTDIDPLLDAQTRAVVEQAVAAIGVPILVGAILDGPGPTYRETAGIVWDPVTGPGETYVKRHPVPFGEYIPLRDELLPLIGRLQMVGRDTFAGSTPGVLDIGGMTVGDVICFEVAYDGIVRDVLTGGADAIVVQTNNATYGGTAQPEQQFEISRLRAMEFGRPVLIASTNGISGVISADGQVLARTAQGTRAILNTEVTARTGLTMSARLGAWPERAMAVGGLMPLAAIWIGALRRRRTAAAPAELTGRESEVPAT